MAETRPITTVGHVVMISPPLLGHMIPLLDLARCLSAHVRVTYVVSASKLNTLEQHGFLISDEKNKTSLTASGIDFIGLFDDNDDDYEIGRTNSNLRLESIVNRMSEPLSHLLFAPSSITSSVSTHSISHPIDLIISDVFLHLPIRLAHENNIMAHFFVPNSLTLLMDFIQSSIGDEKSIFEQNFGCQFIQTLSLVNGIICNSFHQLEKQVFKYLCQQPAFNSNLSIRFVAPLISDRVDDTQSIKNVIVPIKQWLNRQWEISNRSPSVIYVSFGSMAYFTSEQIIEIAHFLAPYAVIWSLKIKFHVHLPMSFTNDEKHLVLDWAPQRLILSHPTVRIFISHGGWNSLLESMLFGKTTLVWPLFADQIQNAYRLEYEFGTGLLIPNTSFSDQQRILSSVELGKYLQRIFDQEPEFIQRVQTLKTVLMQAKESDSQLYVKEIANIINVQMKERMLAGAAGIN